MQGVVQVFQPALGSASKSVGRVRGGLIALALLFTGFGCGAQSGASHDAQTTDPAGSAKAAERSQSVRLPAVAGLFYPGEKAALSKEVDGLLASAPKHYIPRDRKSVV